MDMDLIIHGLRKKLQNRRNQILSLTDNRRVVEIKKGDETKWEIVFVLGDGTHVSIRVSEEDGRYYLIGPTQGCSVPVEEILGKPH